MTNRRSETRFATDGKAEVLVPRRLRRSENKPATVCDVSKSGLRIRLSSQMHEGAEITIHMGDLLVTAEVRRCTKIGPELFEVGLRINDLQVQSNPAHSRVWHMGPAMPQTAAPATAATAATAKAS